MLKLIAIFAIKAKTLVKSLLGVSIEDAIIICFIAMQQRQSGRWRIERSKRIALSIFGRVLKRRLSHFHTSIVKSILMCDNDYSAMPKPFKWGTKYNEVAVETYLKQRQIINI